MALEDDLQELIGRRREIDRALLERHAVEMSVLFTDIVGSTAFFEQRGDIEGLALVHRHNDLLFPIVKRHRGRVVKTIGDSIMAVFLTARDGVACAVALQETLAAETGTPSVERIRVRVGVHHGRVLKDNDDVFGDTVNTAARVASAAEGDEVLVSQAAFAALPPDHGWVAVPRRALAAKGKSEPVPVVAIAWRPQEIADARASAPASQELFIIEIGRVPTGLRVAAMDGETERGTVKAYADVALPADEIDRLAEPFAALAHDGGQPAYVETLVARGRALFDRALPARVRTRILETQRHTLRLHLEDTLVQTPWELLHDGAGFLGCRFSIGRMVTARADAAVPPPTTTANEVVIVANPTGDLPHAEEEGRVIERLFAHAMPGRVVHRGGRLSRAALLDLLGRARILHFAGHVVRHGRESPQGGFLVDDGVVSAADLRTALARSAPLLVFANGCHASTSARWQEQASGSLAQALLLAGVRHALAPLWSVPDADALSFALRFYESALSGVPFGECARRARVALAATHTAPLSFAGYVLYGDPRQILPAEDATLPAAGRTRSGDFPPAEVHAPAVAAGERSSASPTQPVTQAPRCARLVPGVVGGLALGVVGVVAVVALGGPGDAPADAAAPATAAPASRLVHTGPVRVSVMPFKSTGAAEPSLDYLQLGLTEVLVTALADRALGIQLIERGQIDVDIAEIELGQTRYVDPETRAQLGKIAGAEVAVLGAYQLAGEALRFTARFVDVETGEVLEAAKVDGVRSSVFELQDALAVDAKRVLGAVKARMRP